MRVQFEDAFSATGKTYRFVSLAAAQAAGLGPVGALPLARKILLENVLRHCDDRTVTLDHARAIVAGSTAQAEIPFHPVRVLMPDSSGLPLIADLAAMRDAASTAGGDPRAVNPRIPVDLVVDHSVEITVAGRREALDYNLAAEFARNDERYRLVRWAEQALAGLRVVPPGNGICHQINLERLARVVWTETGPAEGTLAFPDSLVGMDSHTSMVNSLGVLGWGVGGIEAMTAMLGDAISIRVPRIVGCRLTGMLPARASTTDLVLTVNQRLRAHGVVDAIVEFFGPALAALSLPQRATLANMAPEYGATGGLFPIDEQTIAYLELTARDATQVALVEAYARRQDLWRREDGLAIAYDDVVEIDLGTVEQSVAGPRRPQDRVPLSQVPATFDRLLAAPPPAGAAGEDAGRGLRDGDVVIAAITSCTNTSNPSVMIAAGLLARNAVARGLRTRPWVKTSLAPGSRVVADYLRESGLQDALDALGFNLAAFGCTTCMGNSGPLAPEIARAITEDDRIVAAVLSGNRNFEGRIHNLVRANYIMSPALVVAYALAGSVTCDLRREPLGFDRAGKPVLLAEIEPDAVEIEAVTSRHLKPSTYHARYENGFAIPPQWLDIAGSEGAVFSWDASSTYIRPPPFLQGIEIAPDPRQDIIGARPLLILGDGVTTDHISPVSQIPPTSPAGRYLHTHGIEEGKLDSYMARRANHEVMLRGTFAHPRLHNTMLPTRNGGWTRLMPDGITMTVDEAAGRYAAKGTPLIVVAGREYGTGSSRDWAAKGTRMLGIRAILAESFERIHRSNLLGMGVVPLEFGEGVTQHTLELDGSETFDIHGLAQLAPGAAVSVTIHRADGSENRIVVTARVNTAREADWYRHDGILPLALRQLVATPGVA